MNTKLKRLRRQLRQQCLKIGSPLVAVAAISCAVLVETNDVNYAYPLELVLKSLVNDTVILTISTK